MKKPQLSFWQIWNMSFGFLGIQFGFALQNANVSRIFETLGADVSQIPILWIAAPVTGLIVQPIVGYLSDNTWNSFGRRRPFFLIGAILASAALFIMPNSPYLWIAAGMLWILDASINITMEPFRAFVGDMLPSEQRTKGFAMQSFFIGIAAFIGSFLPWMMTNWFGISNTAPEGMIPDSVKFSFYFGGIIFFLAVMWTIIKTKEYSPEELEAFEEYDKQQLGIDEKIETPEQSSEERAGTKLRHGPLIMALGVLLSAAVYSQTWAQELYILTVGIAAIGLVLVLVGLWQRSGSRNGMVVVFDDLYLMPKTMKQLAVVQFFSWFALFAMWIYTTSAVTSHIYDMRLDAVEVAELSATLPGLSAQTDADWFSRFERIQGDIDSYQAQVDAGLSNVVASMRVVNFYLEEGRAELSDATRASLRRIEQEYNAGADWVGVAFGIYNGFAALVAFMLPVIAGYTNRKTTHALALVAGAAGLISIYFISNPVMILVSMIGVGLAWASILSMPYAILAGSLPASKMGTYMGIFNFFIVLPQILAASILGFLVGTVFGGQAIYALVLGGLTWILAAGLTFLVDDVDDPDKIKA
ncbi:Major Facilitator Superfamily protein [Cyclonatronum proteinivorum]|uniref:Major Facilitator Superfamily protein n=1 Tax=Cyclonatronum proteinivorum TaxID=1457365 RepID=A0A345UHX5_9BACT|nr:MFS transporter [Cyclonatronum proteinivorum]AXJ00077.1 Major Facilitator Superfamily protein [Cyclonatronum proteinivorum]